MYWLIELVEINKNTSNIFKKRTLRTKTRWISISPFPYHEWRINVVYREFLCKLNLPQMLHKSSVNEKDKFSFAPKVHLEPCPRSMMVHFYKNSWRLLAPSYNFDTAITHSYQIYKISAAYSFYIIKRRNIFLSWCT